MPKADRSAKTAGKSGAVKPEKELPVLRSIKGGKAAPAKANGGKLPAGRPIPPKPVGKSALPKPVPAAADDVPVIALNLDPAKLSPAMAAYFRKCQEKLGFVPNVLAAYAFDMAKLEGFVAMYNDLMLGAVRPVQARARDDRGGGVIAKSLLLLPHRSWRGGAAIFRRSAARRAHGDELSRRAADQASARACSISP